MLIHVSVYLSRFLKNKIFFKGIISYLKWWYLAWLIIGAISVIGLLGFEKFGFSAQNALKLFWSSLLLIIKSYLYLKVVSLLALVMTRSERQESLSKLGRFFFLLFIIDFFALISGCFSSDSQALAHKILEVLPADGFMYILYSKLYPYIPSIFAFIKPQLEGITLLFLSVIISALSREEGSRNV